MCTKEDNPGPNIEREIIKGRSLFMGGGGGEVGILCNCCWERKFDCLIPHQKPIAQHNFYYTAICTTTTSMTS